ncbi:NADH-quinone oxidoreductase subunit NuoF [Candidatus Latescibacterota bacterium]
MQNFVNIRKRARKEWEELRISPKPLIYVGTATCGRSAGSIEVLETFIAESEKHKIDCTVTEVGCIGLCYAEPIVCITKPGSPGIFYGEVDSEKAAELFERYIINDDPMPEYALGKVGGESIGTIPDLFQTPVFKSQVRRTLRNCGFIDPSNIDHYIANEGYRGFEKALSIGSDKVIEEIKQSGLRGRGGAGFPTWRKWTFCKNAEADKKYLICNADEGDPGAFMNRSLLEGDPHALLEGMLIAGYAIGAQQGYIYCRAEYPLALERLETALKQMEEYGLLGDDILDSGFNFQIKIKEGAGAFVCGEETALIASIEGKRGMPTPRPPFPAVSGLWKKPTIINNVESLVSVSLIMRNGADWFAEYGTSESKGTKTFALVGKVKRTGLVEVPLGIDLNEMMYEIGGGVLDDNQLKAVQTGGPSGGCIPGDMLDIPVDYDSLKSAGTIMGSGGMVVMDEHTCMVDFARYFLDFAQKESCGECVPCRQGTRQMLRILEDITSGKGKPEDIDILLEMAEGIKAGSLCGLGQTAPNPVLTTIRYFRKEYEEHIKFKKCSAGVCKEIISSPCQHTCPVDTEVPVYISLIAQKRYVEAFEAILKDNPLPSVCGRVCHHPCESKCQAGKWGNPIAVRALKRFATEYAAKTGIYPSGYRKKPDGEKVAIVGSGPAGLTAGYFLALMDYEVTIFEALDEPGGALSVYIPEYRLPRDVLDADIKNIENAGVTIKTNTRVGKDIPFAKLLSDFKAVYIATGAHKTRKLNIPNEDAEGVLDAMEFLKNVNLKKDVTVGKRVGIIGGGNAAVDAARTAVRLEECENVTIIYRRTKKEMPAFEEEVEALIDEGIEILFLSAPSKIITENGKITGIECQKMKLGKMDESGRRRPVPVRGSEFVVELDTLIVAIGEEADCDFLDGEHEIKVSKWNTVTIDSETYETSHAGVFAGGDVVSGPDTVIKAMSAGKVAAGMIDKYIRGETLERKYELTRPSMYVPPVELTDEELEEADRPEIPSLPVRKRKNNFLEVDSSLTEEAAVKEARRCLRCDLETEDGKQALKS